MPSEPVFIALAVLTIAGAVAAMGLRNLVHCVLSLTVAFAGLAGIYLQLSAQFVGFAQLLIYVGAVAILIVFAILLTRRSESPGQAILSSKWWLGASIAGAVFAIIAGVLLSSKALPQEVPPPPAVGVRQIGDQLMTRYVLPLEVLGLLLTVALIGAVIVAMHEKRASREPAPAEAPGHPERADSATPAHTH